jgi:hypothetical protein
MDLGKIIEVINLSTISDENRKKAVNVIKHIMATVGGDTTLEWILENIDEVMSNVNARKDVSESTWQNELCAFKTFLLKHQKNIAISPELKNKLKVYMGTKKTSKDIKEKNMVEAKAMASDEVSEMSKDDMLEQVETRLESLEEDNFKLREKVDKLEQNQEFLMDLFERVITDDKNGAMGLLLMRVRRNMK